MLNCCYPPDLTIISDGNVKKTMMVILTNEDYMCVTLRPKSEHDLVSSFKMSFLTIVQPIKLGERKKVPVGHEKIITYL